MCDKINMVRILIAYEQAVMDDLKRDHIGADVWAGRYRDLTLALAHRVLGGEFDSREGEGCGVCVLADDLEGGCPLFQAALDSVLEF